MKILRSVSRRGFSVGTAGWFTILRPNTWFPASRLPNNLPGFGSRAEQMTPGALSGTVRPAPWTPAEQRPYERNRMRLASAVFGAVAITSVMLWWIMHP